MNAPSCFTQPRYSSPPPPPCRPLPSGVDDMLPLVALPENHPHHFNLKKRTRLSAPNLRGPVKLMMAKKSVKALKSSQEYDKDNPALSSEEALNPSDPFDDNEDRTQDVDSSAKARFGSVRSVVQVPKSHEDLTDLNSSVLKSLEWIKPLLDHPSLIGRSTSDGSGLSRAMSTSQLDTQSKPLLRRTRSHSDLSKETIPELSQRLLVDIAKVGSVKSLASASSQGPHLNNMNLRNRLWCMSLVYDGSNEHSCRSISKENSSIPLRVCSPSVYSQATELLPLVEPKQRSIEHQTSSSTEVPRGGDASIEVEPQEEQLQVVEPCAEAHGTEDDNITTAATNQTDEPNPKSLHRSNAFRRFKRRLSVRSMHQKEVQDLPQHDEQGSVTGTVGESSMPKSERWSRRIKRKLSTRSLGKKPSFFGSLSFKMKKKTPKIQVTATSSSSIDEYDGSNESYRFRPESVVSRPDEVKRRHTTTINFPAPYQLHDMESTGIMEAALQRHESERRAFRSASKAGVVDDEVSLPAVVERQRPKRGRIGTIPASWARFPSHTRAERNGSAGRVDSVISHDFAGSNTGVKQNGKAKKKHRAHRESFLRNLRDYYRNIFSSKQTEMNRRTSTTTQGWFENPDLEPPNFAPPDAEGGVHNEIHDASAELDKHLDAIERAQGIGQPDQKSRRATVDTAEDESLMTAPKERPNSATLSQRKLSAEDAVRAEDGNTSPSNKVRLPREDHKNTANPERVPSTGAITITDDAMELSGPHEEPVITNMGSSPPLEDLDTEPVTAVQCPASPPPGREPSPPSPKSQPKTPPKARTKTRRFPSVTVIDDGEGADRSVSLIANSGKRRGC
ncbi:hypothetical protein K470DRAFT_51718 [Piedraia hortae CBS 480.64]|uniref:Uncharacterized protein n=1 Tax=Piedraia hortae CBS 480.64 TaxID=1314780 RepID=A0A6A7CAP3_9PEZI|nr:hypothetical protein K470DRAFT_51718 [Piedraia hortae CBS 480.64]